jgi:hypothetical protein
MAAGLAAPINAILICEKVAQSNQIFLYFFPRVGTAFRYGHPTTVLRRSLRRGTIRLWDDRVAGAQAGAALGSTRRRRAM